MTVPADFPSWTNGVALTQANFNAGGDANTGVFTGMFPGETYTVRGVAPTWATVGTVEGVTFTGDVGQALGYTSHSIGERTIVMILEVSDAATSYATGGQLTTGNSYGISTNANRLLAACDVGTTSSGYSTAIVQNTPTIVAAGFCPRINWTYLTILQADGSWLQSNLLAPNDVTLSNVHWSACMIGGQRTTGFNGWVGEQHEFAVALEERHPTELYELMRDLGVKVGITADAFP